MRSLLVALTMLVGGCASTSDVSRDLAVTNDPDHFQIRIGAVENFTHMLEYTWTSTGSVATVIQAGELRNGDAHFEIRDPAGLVIHSKSLRGPGTFITYAGRPGPWRLRVDLVKATGTVDVTVRKPD